MTITDVPQSGVRQAFDRAASGAERGARAPANIDNATSNADSAISPGRTIQDTVTLSEGGQKIVNLARSQDLAQDLKNAPVDASFAAKLKQASADVLRITNLFTQAVRTAFGANR